LPLDPRFRLALYGAFAVLFLTGAVWLVTDSLKNSPDGETWQWISASLLMVHGGIAMVALVLLGALFPVHVRLGWRNRRNRITGPTMIGLNAVLIITAFGLYYSGSDTLRPLTSNVHIVVGFALPAMTLVHVLRGRRSRSKDK
jgi:hypothetical protein